LAVAHTGTSSPGELAKTGLSVTLLTFMGGGIIAAVTYTYLDYRKHKKPLLQSDKEIGSKLAKQYTYWHHLKVVSIPLAQYRIRFIVEEKKQRTSSEVA